MKKIIKITTIISVLLILIIGNTQMINASTFSEFSVRAIIPDNQIDKNQSYFDLKMSPNQTQTIQILITNNSDEAMNAKIALNPASTERNGVIVYNANNDDESLSISISDVATLKTSEITISSKKAAYVDIELNMPSDSFDGVILGGLVVTADSASSKVENNGNNSQVTNQYSYTIGLKLTETEVVVNPDFQLRSVRAGTVNYATSLLINLQNSEAAIVKGMKINAEVYKKGSNEVFRSLELENVDVAPNSNFNVVIDWQNQKIQAGTYRLKLRGVHNEKVWEWDEEFTISSSLADSTNDKALNIVNKENWSLYLNVIFLIVIIYLLFLFWKRRKRNDQEQIQ